MTIEERLDKEFRNWLDAKLMEFENEVMAIFDKDEHESLPHILNCVDLVNDIIHQAKHTPMSA